MLKVVLAFKFSLIVLSAYAQPEKIVLLADLHKAENQSWSRPRAGLSTLIFEAARRGSIQLFDVNNPDSAAIPIAFFQVYERMIAQIPYYKWDPYFDYMPYNEFVFNGKLYRALRGNKGERPDLSPDAWALIEPERYRWSDLHKVYFEYTRKGKKSTLHRLHFYLYDNFSKEPLRYVASALATDVVRVLNESGYLWYKLDTFSRFCSDLFLFQGSSKRFVLGLDSLRKAGNITFKPYDFASIGYDADSYLRIKYRNNMFNEFVMVAPQYGESDDVVIDTLRYDAVNSLLVFKRPEYYPLGDALLLPGTISFSDQSASEKVLMKKKSAKKLNKKVPGIDMYVMERVDVRDSRNNFSFPDDAEIISRFNEDLYQTLREDSTAIPVYSDDSLRNLKTHRRFMLDIIRTPDRLSLWRNTIEYFEGRQVGYLSVEYRSLQHHVDKEPGKNSQYWEVIGELQELQKPASMHLRFQVELDQEGKIVKKTLVGLGWPDENFISYENKYLAFLKVKDINGFLSTHVEKKESWQKAMEILEKSENKYVNMIGYSPLMRLKERK